MQPAARNSYRESRNTEHGTRSTDHASDPRPSTLDTLPLIRQLVAERTELPEAAIQDHHRMLSDLHLNSITVGQLVSEAARRLSLPRVVGLTDFANASVAEVARALGDLQRTGGAARPADTKRQPPGVDVWFESFTVELVAADRPASR